MVRGKSDAVPNGILIGYARVSTEDQSLDLQLDALARAGVEKVFIEKKSAKSIKKRRQLRLALMDCDEGDTLIVWKLDRLTRYLPDMYWILGELDRKGAKLRSLTEHVDTTTAQGRLGVNMATSFAQYERESIAERTKAGIEAIRARRAKGERWGPTPKMTAAKLKRAEHMLNAKQMSGPQVAKKLGVKPPTIYHYFQRKVLKAGTVRFIRKKSKD